MNFKRTFLTGALVVVLMMPAWGSAVWAGGGPEPPPTATIQGPELWGVVVVYCSSGTSDFAVVRVKRVQNCNVETQTLVEPAWAFGCPAQGDESAPLNWSLPAGTQFFDITGTPFIAKVKNFEQTIDGSTNITSFDALFKFWVP